MCRMVRPDCMTSSTATRQQCARQDLVRGSARMEPSTTTPSTLSYKMVYSQTCAASVATAHVARATPQTLSLFHTLDCASTTSSPTKGSRPPARLPARARTGAFMYSSAHERSRKRTSMHTCAYACTQHVHTPCQSLIAHWPFSLTKGSCPHSPLLQSPQVLGLCSYILYSYGLLPCSRHRFQVYIVMAYIVMAFFAAAIATGSIWLLLHISLLRSIGKCDHDQNIPVGILSSSLGSRAWRHSMA